MYIYDIFAIILTGISHVLLYLELIRYHRLSYPMVIILSIVFTILLGVVVTVTGYPELNIVMVLLFLLSLGFMQTKLTFMRNLYFTLASMVSITLVKMVLLRLGMKLFMWSPFNLYLWTPILIHLIVAIIIFISIWLLRNPIQRFAQYIVESPLYYISYALLIIGLIVVLILTTPSIHILATLHQEYGEATYITAFILFFILLLMVLIGSHLTKERLVEEQQDRLDKELLDYVDRLEVMHDELASFRHDYTNVLLTLDQGVRTKNINQIEQIYHNVIAPTTKLINHQELDIVKLSHIKVPEVKSLLSVKVIAAQQQNIQVMVDIPQPIEEIAMPIVNFIRVISVLIDNAIEEAVQSKDKRLQLALFEIEEQQYFLVRNSSDHNEIDLQRIYEKGYSSKKGNEGFGLHSVKHMIDQTPHATLETTFDPPYFTQKLMLKK